MRIAIAAIDEKTDSLVSEAAARAPFFLIFENGKLIKKIKNPFRIGGGGAGFAAAELLADEEVELIVAGKFGGNMTGALDAKKIRYLEIPETSVAEALEKI